MRGSRPAGVLLALSIWFAPTALFAQATGAEILGVVQDESGAVLPGVAVTVTNVDTGITRSLVSEQDGRYRAVDLQVGNYEVQGELQGFRTAVRRGIQLTVGRVAVVDLTLAVGALTESLVVTGDAPLVDVTTSSLGGLVGQQQIEDLPLNGRNFVQLALLETGVAQVRTASNSATFGGGLKMSVNGARMDYNNFMMDGTSINSVNMTAIGGTSGQAMGAEAIQEFQVLTSNFTAEFGRSGGGVINVITKSGTNALSGSASFFNRNDGMDSRNFFDTGDLPPFMRNQFAVTTGGPILRNKTFFFGAYEGLRETLGQTFISTVPTMAARQGILPTGNIVVDPRVRPYLDMFPAPNGRDFGDGRAEYSRTDEDVTTQNFIQFRVDHNFSNADSIFFRFTRDYSTKTAPSPLGDVSNDDDIDNQFATGEYKRIFSPRLLNVVRIGYNKSSVRYGKTHLDPRLDDRSLWFIPNAISPGFGVTVSGLAALGGNTSLPRRRGDDVVQIANTLTFNPGRHSLKTGGEYQYIRTNEREVFRGSGAFNFTNLTNFLRAQPQNFAGVSDRSDFDRRWRQDLMALFIQDDYRITDDLTLNLGVRWEFVTGPSEQDGKASHILNPEVDRPEDVIVGNPLILLEKDLVAPRLGFAWAPGGSTKTSVRGGYGMFYPLIFRYYFGAQRSLPPFIENVNAEAPAISFPNPFAGVTRRSPAGDSVEYQSENPRVDQFNLTVQRELLSNTVVTVGYVGARGYNGTQAVLLNTAIPQILPDGRKFFPAGSVRRNSGWAEYRHKMMESENWYNGLQLKLIHRVREGLQFQTSYTWSHSIDDASEPGTGGLANQQVPQDPYDLDRERGNSAFDIRHLGTINASYMVPGPAPDRALSVLLGGWQVSAIATLSAGSPFTVANSFDRDRDAEPGQSRPNLVPGASNNPILGGPVQYFDPLAFVLQEAGFYGDLGRNTLIGPGLATVDLAVVKNTSLAGRWNMQIRAEMFNLLNRANFGLPQRIVFRAANGVHAADAGRITNTATSARQAQIGMRITF